MTGSEKNKKKSLSFKDYVSTVGTPLAVVGTVLTNFSQYGHRLGLLLLVTGIVLLVLGAGWMLVKRMFAPLAISTAFIVAITLAFYVGRWTAPTLQPLAANHVAVTSTAPPTPLFETQPTGAPAAITARLVSYTTLTSSRAVQFSHNPQDVVIVPNEITVDIIATNVDSQSVLWATNVEDGSPNYYIHNAPCSPSPTQKDHFYCYKQFIGGDKSDVNTHWKISIVRVSPAQSQLWSDQLKQGKIEIGPLPNEITILDTTSVVRI